MFQVTDILEKKSSS